MRASRPGSSERAMLTTSSARLRVAALGLPGTARTTRARPREPPVFRAVPAWPGGAGVAAFVQAAGCGASGGAHGAACYSICGLPCSGRVQVRVSVRFCLMSYVRSRSGRYGVTSPPFIGNNFPVTAGVSASAVVRTGKGAPGVGEFEFTGHECERDRCVSGPAGRRPPGRGLNASRSGPTAVEHCGLHLAGGREPYPTRLPVRGVASQGKRCPGISGADRTDVGAGPRVPTARSPTGPGPVTADASPPAAHPARSADRWPG